MNTEQIIEVTRLALTAVETALESIHAARAGLEENATKLRDALAEIGPTSERLAADRKEADDALDRKFDK